MLYIVAFFPNKRYYTGSVIISCVCVIHAILDYRTLFMVILLQAV